MYLFTIQENNSFVPHGQSIPNGAILGAYGKIDYYCLSLRENKRGFMVVYIYDKRSGRYYKSVRQDALTDMIQREARIRGIKRLDIEWPKPKKYNREEKEFSRFINDCIHENPNSAKFEKKACKSLKRAAAMYEKRANRANIVYSEITYNF